MFFKRKTAYEMRISDWSSDVCSSDLRVHAEGRRLDQDRIAAGAAERAHQQVDRLVAAAADQQLFGPHAVERRQRLDQRRRLWVGVAVAAEPSVAHRRPR